ncbi:MAG TPA: HAEPLYID family protein [Flavipsychrobacter sp.]
MLRKIAYAIVCLAYTHGIYAQEHPIDKQEKDSLYIEHFEKKLPAKVLHAEPLYIDLIRDLGARKGEHEWNIGLGITDNLKYDTYQTLIEYEFAPIDRLGLEIEVPFTFYAPLSGTDKEEVPSHRIESLKTALQWTFIVAPKQNFSAAVGYINELEFTSLNAITANNALHGNVFNPFLVIAKRWGNNLHTLLYTGPMVEKAFHTHHTSVNYAINTNFHYMIPGTRNFVGIEVNKEIRKADFDMVVRPQLRVGITEHLLLGIVGGIPISRENQRFSTFARLIWEPPSKRH